MGYNDYTYLSIGNVINKMDTFTLAVYCIGKMIESASFDFVHLIVGILYNCIFVCTIYQKQ